MRATLQIVENNDENNFDPSPNIGFEDFYALYPRKIARKDAQRAWAKLDDPSQYAAIVGLVDWLRVWKHEAARRDDFMSYLAYPASWLNGERWTDELPAAFRRPAVAARQSEAAEPVFAKQALPDHVLAAIAKVRKG